MQPPQPTAEDLARIVADAEKNTKLKTKEQKTHTQVFEDECLAGFRADARKYWQKYWETCRTNDPDAYAVHAGPAFRIAEKKMESYDDARDPDTPFYLITINPRSNVEFTDLSRKVLKCLSKKWIVDNHAFYFYVFEQRSTEPTKPCGYHCHLLLERPIIEGDRRYRYSAFLREIRSTFTSIVGGPKAVHISPVKAGTELTVIKYFRGDKADLTKLPAVRATREWRKQMRIADWYSSSVMEPEEYFRVHYGGDEDGYPKGNTSDDCEMGSGESVSQDRKSEDEASDNASDSESGEQSDSDASECSIQSCE